MTEQEWLACEWVVSVDGAAPALDLLRRKARVSRLRRFAVACCRPLRPYPAEAMTAYPVGLRVNSPKYDDPSCVLPLAG